MINLSKGPSNQSQDGLAQAYQHYRLELRRFFELNSRDRHAVDDLLQTMYLRVRNLSHKPGSSSGDVRDPRQYLFRAAWNLLHSENRRLRAERSHAVPFEPNELEAQANRSSTLWLEDDATTASQQAELDRALSQLPRACQVAMLRQYRDNKSYKEIADELGVTVHAVKKYIMRSLNHFRMHLNAMELGDVKERNRS